MLACHVLSLYILHCCKHCVKQFKGTFGSIACVLNCQQRKISSWNMSSTLGEMHNVFGYHLLSGATLCCNKDCCKCLLVCPSGGNLTQNGDPRVGKLTFENWQCQIFPGLPTPPILGHTIDRCMTKNVGKNHECIRQMYKKWGVTKQSNKVTE